ncbi:MAG: transposase [Planctomycetia bacterium]|nr:transposase [Planctomycetia bacterium]
MFHVLNRAVGRATICEKASDYAAFEHVLQAARIWVPTMRWLDFCVRPNHWHLVVWPRQDGDRSEYLRWLTVTHTRRWHVVHDTTGTGPLYQGRFKSFPFQEDDHFFTVCCYVQRTALRANLVPRAEQWRWSSLWHGMQSSTAVTLDPWPVPPRSEWINSVNQPETAAELDALRRSVVCGRPFGDTVWQQHTAQQLGLESSLRQPGRPRKLAPILADTRPS